MIFYFNDEEADMIDRLNFGDFKKHSHKMCVYFMFLMYDSHTKSMELNSELFDSIITIYQESNSEMKKIIRSVFFRNIYEVSEYYGELLKSA